MLGERFWTIHILRQHVFGFFLAHQLTHLRQHKQYCRSAKIAFFSPTSLCWHNIRMVPWKKISAPHEQTYIPILEIFMIIGKSEIVMRSGRPKNLSHNVWNKKEKLQRLRESRRIIAIIAFLYFLKVSFFLSVQISFSTWKKDQGEAKISYSAWKKRSGWCKNFKIVKRPCSLNRYYRVGE